MCAFLFLFFMCSLMARTDTQRAALLPFLPHPPPSHVLQVFLVHHDKRYFCLGYIFIHICFLHVRIIFLLPVFNTLSYSVFYRLTGANWDQRGYKGRSLFLFFRQILFPAATARIMTTQITWA